MVGTGRTMGKVASRLTFWFEGNVLFYGEGEVIWGENGVVEIGPGGILF